MIKTTAQVGDTYHMLSHKDLYVGTLAPFDQWLPRKYLFFRFHWNAIWHHRLAMEIAAQVWEKNLIKHYVSELQDYHSGYSTLLSTKPLASNKSISHYVGQCALDCVVNQISKNNLKSLYTVLDKVTIDGAFAEGAHYSKYVTDCFDRTKKMFDSFYENHEDESIREIYGEIARRVRLIKEWQRLISDSDGVMAVIGDGWYEKVEPIKKDGVFNYIDMTIIREKGWLIIKNHRKSKFALHEHPHINELLIAKDDKWIIQGSGMPSYKHIMKKPFRWRRPRNHFNIESIYDFYILWRLRKNSLNPFTVEFSDNKIVIHSTFLENKTIRLPFDDNFVLSTKSVDCYYLHYNGFSLIVRGSDVKSAKTDYAWQSGKYREEKKIKVARITGSDLFITIESLKGLKGLKGLKDN